MSLFHLNALYNWPVTVKSKAVREIADYDSRMLAWSLICEPSSLASLLRASLASVTGRTRLLMHPQCWHFQSCDLQMSQL